VRGRGSSHVSPSLRPTCPLHPSSQIPEEQPGEVHAQVAEVMAAALVNPEASANKTLEVTAEENAAPAPAAELIARVPQV
jgi:hypothetical protein